MPHEFLCSHGKPILAAQLRAGRVILGLSQTELAQRAGLPIEAIAQAEADGEPGASEAAVAAFQAALERQGVIFLDANGGEGPGVRLRRLDPPGESLRPDQLTSENDVQHSNGHQPRQPLSQAPQACQFRRCDAGTLPMAFQVRWQLVGRLGQPLDGGCVGEGFCAYGEAVAAVVEFLRSYPEVSHCRAEDYWLARRSCDADLAVWIWVECHTSRGTATGDQRMGAPSQAVG